MRTLISSPGGSKTSEYKLGARSYSNTATASPASELANVTHLRCNQGELGPTSQVRRVLAICLLDGWLTLAASLVCIEHMHTTLELSGSAAAAAAH